jgi:hypothetical protein
VVAPLRLVLFFGGWSPSSGMTVMVEEDDELDEVVVELEVALVTVDVEEERVDDEVVLVTVRNVASSSAWLQRMWFAKPPAFGQTRLHQRQTTALRGWAG